MPNLIRRKEQSVSLVAHKTNERSTSIWNVAKSWKWFRGPSLKRVSVDFCFFAALLLWQA